jgi:hypothetical protein
MAEMWPHVVGEGALHLGEKRSKGEKVMNNMKDKAKAKVDEAANAVKKASDKVVDKSKDLTHQAGKTVEKGGKRMQDV